MCLCPALRPPQDRPVRPYDVVGTAPAMSTTKAPTKTHLSGLNHTALALAVYASQPGSPQDHARLASRWWPLCGTGLVTRRIPTKGFRVTSLHRFPLPQAYLAQGHSGIALTYATSFLLV